MPRVLSDEDYQLFIELARKVRAFEGAGVVDDPIGVSVDPPRQAQRPILQSRNNPRFAKLTGEGQSAGQYKGEEVDAAGNTLTNGLTWDSSVSDGPDDLFDLNGIDGWYNDSKSLIVKVSRGRDTSGGNTQWVIDHVLGTSSSPKDLTFSGEHPESAQSVSWERGNQGSNDGVKLLIPQGPSYYDGGDETLYQYYITVTFDSLGCLKDITGETRQALFAWSDVTGWSASTPQVLYHDGSGNVQWGQDSCP